MRGPFSLRSEILHGLDEARAEVHLPEAVYGDARGERVPAVGKPARQAEAVVGPLRTERRQNGRHAGRDLVAVIVVSAALKNERIAGGTLRNPNHRGNKIPSLLALPLAGTA